MDDLRDHVHKEDLLQEPYKELLDAQGRIMTERYRQDDQQSNACQRPPHATGSDIKAQGTIRMAWGHFTQQKPLAGPGQDHRPLTDSDERQ